MLLSLQRLAYRLAAPLAHAWWDLWRAHHEGAKCVVTNAGEVVLVRHTYGDRRRWDLPGGYVRRREEPPVAARRELAEELGVELGPEELRRLGALALRCGRRTDTVHYFAIEVSGRALEPDPVELAEVAWFSRAGLPSSLGQHVPQVLAWIEPTDALASVATDPGSPDRG